LVGRSQRSATIALARLELELLEEYTVVKT